MLVISKIVLIKEHVVPIIEKNHTHKKFIPSLHCDKN